jgi:membrane-bound lytic murein transglycosylase D
MDPVWELYTSGNLEAARDQVQIVLERIWIFGLTDPSLARSALDLWAILVVLENLPEDEPLPEFEVPWWTAEVFHRPEVQAWKEKFLADGGHELRTWMRRAAPYCMHVQDLLEEAGLPREMWVLTVVESGFRSNARSRSNAVGPWQLVANTARYCGLLLTLDRDQRRDWEDATRAAGKYLLELKATFEDGLLALAAFNCGPSRVRREVAGRDSVSFWGLQLPPETRSYVPRVLALVKLLGAGAGSEFMPDDGAGLDYDTLPLPHPVRLADLAGECEIEVEELIALNPSWLRPVTPGDGHPVTARVPSGTQDRVLAGFRDGRIPEIKLSPDRLHRVERGDTLWDISRRYHVRLKTLLQVNGMSGKETIHPGRVIRLPG